MPKLTVSTGGVLFKEIELSKARTTLGRRRYNDIVIDNLAVSGEHALFLLRDGQIWLEDLGSTNGTYVNGKAIRSMALRDEDVIEIGRYELRLAQAQAAPADAATAPEPASGLPARIRVLDGPAAGREAQLLKEVTTLGKPGVAVVAIARQAARYQLQRLGGTITPKVNFEPVGQEPVPLEHEDLIELADTRLQFLQG
ncbi:MAG: hypothetical protein RJA36_228 [Pseudomonadota bacterium]|jgi:pSer/pThr/pTyr-binding forkhead associated (FHA) protein